MSGLAPIEKLDPGLRQRARVVLFVFLLTFIASRLVVFMIMARWLPDLYLHLGGTHIHHLNYGIFLLAGVGAYLLFAHPSQRRWRFATIAYAIGLALTFDEFGMWVHLGGGYWQRASFDAVIVLAALLGLLAFAPAPRTWPRRHLVALLAVCVAASLFYLGLVQSFQFAARMEIRLHSLDQDGPT